MELCPSQALGLHLPVSDACTNQGFWNLLLFQKPNTVDFFFLNLRQVSCSNCLEMGNRFKYNYKEFSKWGVGDSFRSDTAVAWSTLTQFLTGAAPYLSWQWESRLHLHQQKVEAGLGLGLSFRDQTMHPTESLVVWAFCPLCIQTWGLWALEVTELKGDG